MMARLMRLGLLALLLIGCGATVLWLRRDNERLERRLATGRAQEAQIARLRAENARARTLQDTGSGTAAIDAEIARLQAEIAGREKGGQGPGPVTDALDRNRDPEKELTRIEFFREVGNATPRAALQSLMAAALRGDDGRVAGLMAFDGPARAEIEAQLARLPPALRAKYPTPESLAALLFAEVVTGHDAARLVREDFSDPRHATVTVAFARTPAGRPLPLELGAGGWQLAISAELLPELRRALGAAPAPRP